MPIPTPEPGLVISYSYLWLSEYEAGRDEGVKDRPSVIVLVVERAGDATIVTVLPITHSAPRDPCSAVEIPPAVNAISASTIRDPGSSSAKAMNFSGQVTICASAPIRTTMISASFRLSPVRSGPRTAFLDRRRTRGKTPSRG